MRLIAAFREEGDIFLSFRVALGWPNESVLARKNRARFAHQHVSQVYTGFEQCPLMLSIGCFAILLERFLGLFNLSKQLLALWMAARRAVSHQLPL